jgi:hypothetical protein
VSTEYFTIGAETCADEIGELDDGLDVAENGLVETLEIFVPILEDWEIIVLGDLETHGGRGIRWR